MSGPDNSEENSFAERVQKAREQVSNERYGEEPRSRLDVRMFVLSAVPGLAILILPEAWFGNWAWIQPWLVAAYVGWANYYLLSRCLTGLRLLIVWCGLPLGLIPGVAAYLWLASMPYSDDFSEVVVPLFFVAGLGAYFSWARRMVKTQKFSE